MFPAEEVSNYVGQCFITIFSYLLGTYEKLAEEGQIDSGGGKTLKRMHHPITSNIDLIDSRGMQSFADTFLKDIEAQIRTST